MRSSFKIADYYCRFLILIIELFFNEPVTIILGKLNQMAKCAYIMNNLDACEGGGYIPWSQLQLCAYETPALQTVLIVVAILFFLYLFLLLTTTADDFFCSNIAAIIDFHKISQNVAGITFMAFGNGAPDLFTSVASVISVSNPQPGLAISELLGGTLFSFLCLSNL